MSRIGRVVAGRTAALVIVGLCCAGVCFARPTPEAKCAAAKDKAAAKKITAKLVCQAKAVLAGAAVDPACLTAAETKFGATIAKVEAAGGCAVTGDTDAIETACDDAVATVVALAHATTTSTTTTTTLPVCSTNGAACGSCGVGGICVVRTAEYIADNACAGGAGTCTCCTCVDGGACDNTRTCSSDADCAPGTACIVVPLPTGGAGLCCSPCP